MSAYMVFNYTIDDQEGYQAYLPAAAPTMAGRAVEVLAADYDSEPKEGQPGKVTVILRFESKEAALDWYDSPEYQEAMKHRAGSSTGIAVLCAGLPTA